MRAQHLELKQFLREHVYRHHRVLRMTTKAQRVVRELFDAFMDNPQLLPDEYREHGAGGRGTQDGDRRPRAHRRRLHRRHDRPLRDPRAPATVRSERAHLAQSRAWRYAARPLLGRCAHSRAAVARHKSVMQSPQRAVIPTRERLIFALDVPTPEAARGLVERSATGGPVLQARAGAADERAVLRAARMARRARQEDLRRLEVLRYSGDRRRGGASSCHTAA